MTSPQQGLRDVVADALKAATPSLKELADEVGVSYQLLRQFAGGHRNPPPPVARALAKVLRGHAKRLQQEAAHLSRAARIRKGE